MTGDHNITLMIGDQKTTVTLGSQTTMAFKSITLMCGASVIQLTPGSISLTSPTINLAAGTDQYGGWHR